MDIEKNRISKYRILSQRERIFHNIIDDSNQKLLTGTLDDILAITKEKMMA